MLLNFKEWLYETRHPATLNPDVKKWVDSADKLKQTVEKLKAMLKKKQGEKKPEKPEIEKKPIRKPEEEKRPGKPEKEEEKEKKPERPEFKARPKPEERPEERRKPEVKPEPKNIIQRPTRLEKERLDNKKGSDRNGRQPE